MQDVTMDYRNFEKIMGYAQPHKMLCLGLIDFLLKKGCNFDFDIRIGYVNNTFTFYYWSHKYLLGEARKPSE